MRAIKWQMLILMHSTLQFISKRAASSQRSYSFMFNSFLLPWLVVLGVGISINALQMIYQYLLANFTFLLAYSSSSPYTYPHSPVSLEFHSLPSTPLFYIEISVSSVLSCLSYPIILIATRFTTSFILFALLFTFIYPVAKPWLNDCVCDRFIELAYSNL